MLMSWVFVLLVCLIAFFNHLPLDTGWLLHLVVGVAKCSSLTGLLGYAHWLFRIAFAPAWQPYRIGYLFTHKNGDFGAISVAERSCAAPSPCRSRRWSVTYQIGSLSHFGVVGTGTQMCPSPLFQCWATCILEHWDDWNTQINTGEGENHTSVSRFMTSSPYSELQQDRSTLHSPVGIAHTAAWNPAYERRQGSSDWL